jgi:hypothetical protein
MNMATEWKFPGYFNIVDEDDNVLMEYRDLPDFKDVAKKVATEQGKIVYAYCGNGRAAFEPAPSVGMGCTLCFYTDRHAGTIIAVSPSGHMVTVREDKAVRTDSNGMSEDQDYRFEPDPNGAVHKLYRQGDGRYGKSPRLVLGVRGAYHDYSF